MKKSKIRQIPDGSKEEPAASEVPAAKRGHGFWRVGKYLLPIALVGVGLTLWQVWGQEKAGPKGQRTLLTSPRPESPEQPSAEPEAPAEPQPPSESLSEAEEILLKCASAYAQASSWRAAYSLASAAKAASVELPMSASVEAAVRKPNKYVQVSRGAGLMGISLDTTTVSDGANIYTYVESLRQAMRAAAPQDLTELARALAPEMPTQVSEVSLMAGINPLESVGAVTLTGTEEVNGRLCHVLDLTFKADSLAGSVEGLLRKAEGSKEPPKNVPFRATSGSQRLWIDSADFLIRKQQLDMTMDMRSAAEEVFGGQVLSLALPEAMEKTIIQTYSEVQLNESLPDTWFTFVPPAGVKVVEHLDFGSLLEDVLGP